MKVEEKNYEKLLFLCTTMHHKKKNEKSARIYENVNFYTNAIYHNFYYVEYFYARESVLNKINFPSAAFAHHIMQLRLNFFIHSTAVMLFK